MCNNSNNNTCGCCEKLSSKCVLYKGQCLDTLNICSGEDLETIIIIIDSLLQDILQQIEDTFIGMNVGGGSEVYKGLSETGVHQFRTLVDSVSVNVQQEEDTITLTVDEEWLTEIILELIEGFLTGIESSDNSILVSEGSSDTIKDITLNPDTFSSNDGSISITTATPSGNLNIDLSVDEDFIIDIVTQLIPDVLNVGSGADIYKGLSSNTHEFRGIDVSIQQPDNPGLLSGTITASSTVVSDNVVIDIDFSNLTATPQSFGIPEYYVNSSNPNNGDGSSVNPFKTWELCKTAIGGTPNTSRNIKVIFQSDVTSSADLTLNGVNYVFQNNSTFTYTGSGATIDYSLFTGSVYKSLSLSGTGSLQQSTHSSNTLNTISVIGGDGSTFSRSLHILGDITIIERARISDPSTDPSNFILVDRLDAAGLPIYGYNETFSKGTVYMSGKNINGESLIHIYPNCSLTIRDRINTAIELTGSGTGVSGMTVEGTLRLLHIGNYYRYESVGGSSPNTYLIYSDDIPRIHIDSGYTVQFNNGIFKASHTGSSNSGGYSSLVKLTGTSSLDITRDSRMVVDMDLFYRYLFEVEDESVIKINTLNTSTLGYSGTNQLEHVFYADSPSAPSITIDFGKMQWDGSGTLKNSDVTSNPYTNWLFVNGTPVSSSMPTAPSADLQDDIYSQAGILNRG